MTDNPGHPEIDAMAIAHAAISALDDAAQERVMRWLTDRLMDDRRARHLASVAEA